MTENHGVVSSILTLGTNGRPVQTGFLVSVTPHQGSGRWTPTRAYGVVVGSLPAARDGAVAPSEKTLRTCRSRYSGSLQGPDDSSHKTAMNDDVLQSLLSEPSARAFLVGGATHPRVQIVHEATQRAA